MVVISSAELRNNMKKYLDTAANETVVIQRGKTEMFVLHKPDSLTEVPADFYQAICADEVIYRIEKDMRTMCNE